MRLALALLLALLLPLTAQAQAQAQGLRTNMGRNAYPNGGLLLNSLPFFGLGSASSIASTAKAQSFIAVASGLGDVELQIGRSGSFTGTILVQLRADNIGTPATTVLQTLASYTTAQLPASGTATFEIFPIVLTTPLQVGARYWIYITKSGTVAAQLMTTNWLTAGFSLVSMLPGSTSYSSNGTSAGVATKNNLMMCISVNGPTCGAQNGPHQ